MTDLITRLRTWSHARHAAPASDLMDEAADEIERLRGLLSRTGSDSRQTGDDATECHSKREKLPERDRQPFAWAVCWSGRGRTHNTEDQEHRMENSTTPQDSGAMPPASHGSVAGEPVAWAVTLADGERIYDVYAIEEEAKAIDEAVTGNHGVIPLYRSPTLTDAEREAVEYFSGWCMGPSERLTRYGDTLRGLLERLNATNKTDGYV